MAPENQVAVTQPLRTSNSQRCQEAAGVKGNAPGVANLRFADDPAWSYSVSSSNNSSRNPGKTIGPTPANSEYNRKTGPFGSHKAS